MRKRKPALFHDPAGRMIRLRVAGGEAFDAKALMGKRDHGFRGLRRVALAPAVLPEVLSKAPEALSCGVRTDASASDQLVIRFPLKTEVNFGV